MNKLFYILTVATLISCTTPKTDTCQEHILDLEMTSFEDHAKLFDYYEANTFVAITDISQILRYEEPDPERIAHYFQPSATDPAKRKYTHKVKEGVIKTPDYQWDLFVLIDNDQKDKNICYTLKSYNNDRKQIGHLDFAAWSADNKIFLSGRIDCDSTLHMILDNGKEHRIFKTDPTGKNELVETIMKP